MLEAIDLSRRIIYGRKSQTPEQQNELKRIIRDGHIILEHKSEYIYQPTISCCRNTQLYRTLLHEIGHYVQYLECTVRKKCSHSDQIDYEELYHKIPKSEKESFAHKYAETKKEELERNGVIPFDRMLDFKTLRIENLDINDFTNMDIEPNYGKKNSAPKAIFPEFQDIG